MTLRHVQNQRGTEGDADFYLTLAEVEEHFDNRQAAREALQLGIEKKAEPLDSMRDVLLSLESKEPENEVNKAPAKRQAALVSSSTSTTKATTQSPKKRTLEQGSSPKRRKAEAGAIAVKAETTNLGRMNSDEYSSDLSETKHSIRFQLAPQQRLKEHEVEMPVFAPKDRKVIGSSSEKPSAKVTADKDTGLGNKEFIKKLPGPFSPVRNPTTMAPRVHSLAVDGPSRAKRPPLLSKTPRLSRVGLSGLSGRARRADPDQSIDIESESGSESESTRRTGTREKPTSKPQSAAKVKKVDLSYMFAWDPTAPRGSATKEYPADCAVKAKLDKIDEAPPSLSSSTASVVTAGASTASHSSSNHSTERKSLLTSDCLDVGTPVKPAQGTPQRHYTSPETAALIATSNRDFLPLVSENNMLRVNDVPYVKLGVIGKGGSCKVYRALSKDCAVVAIKKVKLEGMDKKGIAGYANEIALLKRLRGNPAIIQMFDSEVDLERKAIFVTMEVGEVDLNHVLQQQALLRDGSGSDGRRNLNMNFIRLTWQQMLSAVHCIHEERIIHSDLKPANFLFVRGALKLIDFGIAKAIQSDDTTNIYRESQIGTLNYMSPEAILDTGSGQNGARMRIGRVSCLDYVCICFLLSVFLTRLIVISSAGV
jgi:serine/threonine-protein kinase TTK/MPS1